MVAGTTQTSCSTAFFQVQDLTTDPVETNEGRKQSWSRVSVHEKLLETSDGERRAYFGESTMCDVEVRVRLRERRQVERYRCGEQQQAAVVDCVAQMLEVAPPLSQRE